jgi:hypothetical protein
VDYYAASQSVKLLDVLADALAKSEQCARRIQREKERQRREKLAANKKLVARVLEIEPTANFDDIAA